MQKAVLPDQLSYQEHLRQERLERYRAYLASNPNRPVLQPDVDVNFLISEIARLIGPKQQTRDPG